MNPPLPFGGAAMLSKSINWLLATFTSQQMTNSIEQKILYK
jgi:hypothetical protein